MAYTEEDTQFAMIAHDCTRQEAIDNGYSQAVADDRAAQKVKFQLEDLRTERNKKLAETDYWGASDTPTMSQAQIDYRQALRDITDTYTSLSDVVWPTKP